MKRLLNLYCEMFETCSYGGNALTSLCVLRHMNLCRLFPNINPITYNSDMIYDSWSIFFFHFSVIKHYINDS